MKLLSALTAIAMVAFTVPSYADPLSDIKAFTLSDVKTAESIYAANPSVPTFAAANQCLGYLDETLSQTNTSTTFGDLSVPKGAVSTIADIDVAINTATNGLSPIVLTFNQNCGAYIEDLKAETAKHTIGLGVNLFGLHL